MALARWRAELDVSQASAKLASVAKRQVAQSPTDQFGARAAGLPAQGKPEGNAVENPPYAFPFYRLDAVVADGVGAGGLLALGRPFAHRLLRRELRRRAGAGLEEGPFRFPPRAAGATSHGISRCWRRAAREAGWGKPLPAGIGPRHRAARLVRLDRGAGRRGRRARRPDAAGQARHLRHRLRPGGQSRDRAHADGKRHHLRPVGRALRRDHPGRRRRRAVELPGLRRRASRRCAGDVGASRRWRFVVSSAASASPARRRSRRRSPTRCSPPPASACAACRCGSPEFSARHLAPPAQRVLDLDREVALSAASRARAWPWRCRRPAWANRPAGAGPRCAARRGRRSARSRRSPGARCSPCRCRG